MAIGIGHNYIVLHCAAIARMHALEAMRVQVLELNEGVGEGGEERRGKSGEGRQGRKGEAASDRTDVWAFFCAGAEFAAALDAGDSA